MRKEELFRIPFLQSWGFRKSPLLLFPGSFWVAKTQRSMLPYSLRFRRIKLQRLLSYELEKKDRSSLSLSLFLPRLYLSLFGIMFTFSHCIVCFHLGRITLFKDRAYFTCNGLKMTPMVLHDFRRVKFSIKLKGI